MTDVTVKTNRVHYIPRVHLYIYIFFFKPQVFIAAASSVGANARSRADGCERDVPSPPRSLPAPPHTHTPPPRRGARRGRGGDRAPPPRQPPLPPRTPWRKSGASLHASPKEYYSSFISTSKPGRTLFSKTRGSDESSHHNLQSPPHLRIHRVRTRAQDGVHQLRPHPGSFVLCFTHTVSGVGGGGFAFIFGF